LSGSPFGSSHVSFSRVIFGLRQKLVPAFLMIIMLGGSVPWVLSATPQVDPSATLVPAAQYDQEIKVTIPGGSLYAYQCWNGFKEGAKPTDPPINVCDSVQSNASVKFTFTPIDQTVTGTMTGAYSNPSNLVNVSFAGTVAGVMAPEYWSAGRWHWEINATASIILTFSWGNRTGPDTVVWTTKSIPISDEFIISALDRTSYTIVDFDIYWADNGGIGGGSRFFSLYSTGEGYNSTRFPVPLDFDYVISGPDAVSTSSPSAQFSVQTTGEDADMVQNASWEFYYKNKYTEVWTLCSYSYPTAVGRVYRTDDSPLTLSGSQIASWSQIFAAHGVSQGGNTVLPMRVMMTFCADAAGVQEMVQWEEWSSSTFDFVLQEQAVLSGQIGGLGLPMKYAKLEFRAQGGTYTGSADEDGRFTVPYDASKSGAFTLAIIFAYQRDGTTYFTLHEKNTSPDPASDTTPPVCLELSVNNGEIAAATFRYRSDYSEAVPVPGGSTIAAINLDGYLNPENKIDFFTGMYVHLVEAVEFYKDYLGVDLTGRTPLKVYTNVAKETAYDYSGQVSYITINKDVSYEGAPTEPKNREYHEFSHYAMHCLYGEDFEYPEPASAYTNHGGYINPTTIDSYQEAFAYFMSAVMGTHHGNYWDTGNTASPDSLGMKGSLEDNFRAWDREGRAEEMAIAGVLWDLYDGGREVMSTEANVFSQFISKGDLDHDSQINRTEMLLLCLDTSFQGPYMAEDGTFNSTHFAAMVADNNWTQGEIEDRLLERVGENIAMINPLLSTVVEKDSIITAILDLADSDSSGSLDYGELFASAPDGVDRAVFATLSMEYLDGDLDGALRGNELAALGVKVSFDEYESQHINVIMSKYGVSSMPDEDDVDLEFLPLWDVLKVPHRNFKSVYDLLVSAFPAQAEGIDAIFIAHGIYSLRYEGDHYYTPGEPYYDSDHDGSHDQGEDFIDIGDTFWDEAAVIGQASNLDPLHPSRSQRSSLISFPGQTIRVNNSVSRYWMELTYIDPYVDGGFPIKYHKIQLSNINGSIYFPIPPPAYDSEVRVYPDNTTYASALFFTSAEFEESYFQSVAQGYFVEHDFQIASANNTQPPANQTKSGCFIATATYGSEAAPQVQALRGFRDGVAMKTFAGSSFMTGFLTWYYSWSPPVADAIAPDGNAKAVMRVVLQPLLGILDLSASVNSALYFNGELAIVVAGFAAASLIGIVYFLPLTTLALVGAKRYRKGFTLPGASRVLLLAGVPWAISVALIAVAEMALSPALMVVATLVFVTVTIIMVVGTASIWLARFLRTG